MKIGLDVSQMVYTGHGVGRYVEGLTRALLTRRDHSYVLYAGVLRQRGLLTMRSHHEPWSSATWHLPLLPPRLARLVFNYTSLSIERFIGQVDIFHSSDWTEPYANAPKVTTVHDLAFLLYPETVRDLVKATQAKRLERVIAHQTHIIADSHSTKADLIKHYALEPERIDVVYPGISAQFEPQTSTVIARVKKKYNLPTQYLLAVGTKEPRKNLPRLVEAIRGLGLPLVITGRQGWGKALAINSQVIETGFVEESDLPGVLSGAEVFVYPSLYEGFGFPVGEAMATAVPVVTSQVSSLPEVAGDAAILVDPLDTRSIHQGIKAALQQSSKLKQRGLAQAKKFSWSRCAAATVKVYEKVYAHHH